MSERLSFALPGAVAHYAPDRTVRVAAMVLDLAPDRPLRTLHATVMTTVVAIDDVVATLTLDAVDLTIDRVFDATGDLQFASTPTQLYVTLRAPLASGDTLTFGIDYRAIDPTCGMYFIDHADHVWTQSQDTDARAWIPCFDHPVNKMPTTTLITVPNGDFALGNGALIARSDRDRAASADVPRSRFAAPEYTTFVYRQDVPHPTYLLTMVAGAFEEVVQAHARVPIAWYVAPGRTADGERAFGNTPAMLDTFERVFGHPYPFARYSQIAVADFIFGGMENTGATTQTDRTLHDARAHLDFSSDGLVSHELTHQWFGDLVTCRDWAHAWLNEGFATYGEAVWTEAHEGWDAYSYKIHEILGEYLEEDGERYRRPVVCNIYRDPIELFDRHLYQKGGAILHMLRGDLGWERLQRVFARYLADNATRNVETIDFIRAIEATTGRNPRAFFDQMVDRGGHPQLTARTAWDSDAKRFSIEIEQTQPIDADHPAYVFDLEIGIVPDLPLAIATDAGSGPMPGEQRLRVRVASRLASFSFTAEQRPALVRIDPNAWLLAAWKMALSTDECIAILSGDAAPVARIRAARALARDHARSAREALAAALMREPFWGVAVEIAKALGGTQTPSAREALVAALGHEHPKVRRAVASALGAFRGSDVADALFRVLDDSSYFVCGAALHALGKMRDSRAFDTLLAALGRESWNDTIASGAARGLGELLDERAIAPLVEASAQSAQPLRRAALGALAHLGTRLAAARTAAVEAVRDALTSDTPYLVRMSAYDAAETLADARLLGALDRLASSESDGRARRDAAEAARRVRAALETPTELARLREDLDALRSEVERLRMKADATPA